MKVGTRDCWTDESKYQVWCFNQFFGAFTKSAWQKTMVFKSKELWADHYETHYGCLTLNLELLFKFQHLETA